MYVCVLVYVCSIAMQIHCLKWRCLPLLLRRVPVTFTSILTTQFLHTFDRKPRQFRSPSMNNKMNDMSDQSNTTRELESSIICLALRKIYKKWKSFFTVSESISKKNVESLLHIAIWCFSTLLPSIPLI